ncbi:hypothetical protein ACIQ6R_13080 [Streptomyces sp. NPDC096048]|uniref:hypothetical protein n=1 Tax=Streptomyces sp. NPDC096048 TaxID=3366072 RepID=UPI00381D7AF5
MWFITRRRHNAEITALRSYTDALRERCKTAEENERAERAARRTITRQHAELDAANRRLAGRNEELGKRISALSESDPEYAADLEKQLAEEKQRADRLQARLDDALGLNDGAVEAGRHWQHRRSDRGPKEVTP